MSIAIVTDSPSRSFLAGCSLFCLGILVGPLFGNLPIDVLFVPFLVCAAAAVVATKKSWKFAWLMVGLFLFGVFRYAVAMPHGSVLLEAGAADGAMSGEVLVSGRVSGEVLRQVRHARLEVGEASVNGKPTRGKVLLYTPREIEARTHDRISFECRLDKPEPIETFRYDLYLRSQGIYAICGSPSRLDVEEDPAFDAFRLIYAFKEMIQRRLLLLFPEPHASFVSGLLFGGSSALSPDLREDFSRVGASHILAASGFNLSLFTFVFLGWILKTRLGRRKGIILTVLLIVLFVIMAGLTSAVLRAALMSATLLLSLWARRKPYLPNVVLFSVAILLLQNPLVLLDDVGFQLSVVAIVSLLTLAKRLEPYLNFFPESFGIREAVVGSLAATLATLPIIIWHFGAVSIIAPVVNLFILPLVPVLMALTLAALGASVVYFPLGQALALVAWAFSLLILYLVYVFGSLTYASLPVAWPKPVASILAGVYLAYLVWRSKRPAVHPDAGGSHVSSASF